MTMAETTERAAFEACPFCGAQPEDADVGPFVVTCPSCGISGPWGRGRAQATAAWNRRAAHPVAVPAQAAAERTISAPYTLAEIEAKIASNDYNAELLLQHAMLLLVSASVQPGYAVVPVEPTDEMMNAGKRVLHASNGRGAREKSDRIYRAMVAAASLHSQGDTP